MQARKLFERESGGPVPGLIVLRSALKSYGSKAMMSRNMESDSFIVSEKPLNKIGDKKPMAEKAE